jgi:hypothetical protein
MLNYDTYIIKSENNIKYLYLNDLMFKMMFKIMFYVAEISKNYFDDKVN